MSAILNYSETIDIKPAVNLRAIRSNSGIRSAQIKSPVLYELVCSMPICPITSPEAIAIQSEIIDLNYGELLLTTEVAKSGITTQRGLFNGTPVVNGLSQLGKTINIDGATNMQTGWGLKNDYVQFQGDTKVFQLTEDVDSNATGDVVLKLNTPVRKAPSDGSALVFGSAVTFQLEILDYQGMLVSPGGLADFGTVRFRESLLL